MKSTDLQEITKARQVIKGQITIAVNKLTSILGNQSNGDFDHENIVRIEAVQTHTKLDENFQLFQKLHLKYCEHRAVGADDTEEEALVLKDGQYLDEVQSKVYLLLDKFTKYDRSYKVHEAKQESVNKIPELEKEYKKVVEDYQIAKDLAGEIVKCLDKVSAGDMFDSAEIKIQPASDTKQSLTNAFDALAVKAAELISALETRGDTVNDIEGKVKFMHSQENKAVNSIIVQLNKIIAAQKHASDANKSASQLPLNSTFREVASATPIKLNKPEPIKFSGQPRDFASFKRDFEAIIVPNRAAADIGLYLKQAVPHKHIHLIANVDTANYIEMLNILAAEFGTKEQIIDSVVYEVEKMKHITTDKMFLEFVEKLEKIHRDLKTVAMLEEVANAMFMSKLENKLPTVIDQEWTKAVIKEKHNEKSSKDKFEEFMKFLAEHKKMVKYKFSEARQAAVGSKTQTQVCFVTGLSTKIKINPQTEKVPDNQQKQNFRFEMKPCLACDDGATNVEVTKHSMETCEVWNSLKVKDKESKVKCKKHPFTRDHSTADCSSNIRACKICKERTHHSLLCPKRKVTTKSAKTSITAKTNISSSLETPVIVYAMYVQGLKGRIGTLLDNCSTDNYITNSMARRNNLVGEHVELLVEGIGGEKNKVDSYIFQVPIKDKTGRVHVLECYGMDVIATPVDPPNSESYLELCSKFGVSLKEVQRPKSIDLLISMRENHLLADSKLKTIGRMTLYQGLLGKVFGGSDPNLKFTEHNRAFKSTKLNLPTVVSHTMKAIMKEVTHSHTAKTDREILDFFNEENIGAECSPKCGNCL